MTTIQLDHTEIVRAVQKALFAQLARDGKLTSRMELGLTFYAHLPYRGQGNRKGTAGRAAPL